MPNYCENDLWIHADPETRDRIAQELQTEYGVLDFNQIIPYPSDWAEMDKKAREAEKRLFAMTEQERQAVLAKDPHALDLPKDGFNSGGYEWCVKNWGVKWNAGGGILKRSKRSLFYRFETAWAPPLPVVQALSRKYPTARVTIKFYEMGMAFQGRFVFRDGEILDQFEGKYYGRRGG
jgi:hypothetical protein